MVHEHNSEKDRLVYCVPNRALDLIHRILAALPERTQLLNLQDQTHVDDHPSRDSDEDQECG